MPDTKPTPTVIDSDRKIAEGLPYTGCDAVCRRRDVAKMAAEIAAAREAWGVSREAVAALVEAAQGFLDGRHAAVCQDAPGGKMEPWAWCECRFRYMRAALERVKEAQG